ncbi:MAG: DUF4838 domain-containing protein [Saprospiraceae bacterium]|nr:DUF4838 domain-containing protein [Lewinella sp.]
MRKSLLIEKKFLWVSLILWCLFSACGKKVVNSDPKADLTTVLPPTHKANDPGLVQQEDLSNQITLVEQGRGAIPIIVYPEAPPRTLASAEELADYIKKITGIRPPVITRGLSELPDKAIWVGVQPAVRQIFPNVDFSFYYPEETLIHADGSHLIIAGRDRWLEGGMYAQGDKKIIEGIQLEYGTCNAIYTFLQDYLGVRWLGPGELWEEYPRRPNLSIPAIHYRYHPQLRSREGVFHFMELGSKRSSEEEKDWLRRNRLQYSSLNVEGGHGFTEWWEKYHEDHLDYFALLPNGKRELDGNPKTVKLCMSNPAVWRQWLVEVKQKLKENPSQQVFNASSNDGWTHGHCTCADCRAWDEVPMTAKDFNLSDRNVRFANELARLLKTEFPAEDYYVLMHAYGDIGRKVPVKAQVADNVIVASVHNFYVRDSLESERFETMKEQFLGWSRITDRLIWRPNIPGYAGTKIGMPDIALRESYEQVKFAVEQGIIGLWIDTYWGHWSTQLPQYYLLSQLVWNPSREYEAIMEDFYARAYGEAAFVMQDYWELTDRKKAELLATTPEGYSTFFMHQIFNEEWLSLAHKKLDLALSMVKDDQRLSERIQFHRAGLEVVEQMLELKQLQLQFARSRESGQAKLNAKMSQVLLHIQTKLADSPPHAFNRMYTIKEADIHENPAEYEFKPSKKMLKAIKKRN